MSDTTEHPVDAREAFLLDGAKIIDFLVDVVQEACDGAPEPPLSDHVDTACGWLNSLEPDPEGIAALVAFHKEATTTGRPMLPAR